MSIADKLPKACITKESLNAEIVDSYSRYTPRVMTVLDWLERFEDRTLKRIEQLINEADSQGNEMTPQYQLSVYLKVSELVLKLEDVRFKLIDKCSGIGLPSAPPLQTSVPAIPPEVRTLMEMLLVAKAQTGFRTSDLVDACIEQLTLRAKKNEQANSISVLPAPTQVA